MFTNNFYNFLKVTMLKSVFFATYSAQEVDIDASNSGLVDTAGTACGIQQYTSTASMYSVTANAVTNNQKVFTNNTISLGTGITPPELTDYELAEKCSNLNLSATRVISRELSAENVKILWTMTGFNSNNEAVTISELGLYKRLTNTSGDSTLNTILLARSLLPNPITVQPQENFIINYEIVI